MNTQALRLRLLPLSLMDLTCQCVRSDVSPFSLSSASVVRRNVVFGIGRRRWMSQLSVVDSGGDAEDNSATGLALYEFQREVSLGEVKDAKTSIKSIKRTRNKSSKFLPHPRQMRSKSRSSMLHPADDLRARIDALVNIPVEDNEHDAENSSPDTPYYSENDLVNFYINVLAPNHPVLKSSISSTSIVDLVAEQKDDREIVLSIANRILALEPRTSNEDSIQSEFLTHLQAHVQMTGSESGHRNSSIRGGEEEEQSILDLHQRLLVRLDRLVTDLEDVVNAVSMEPDGTIQESASTSTSTPTSTAVTTPIIQAPVLLEDEWHSLLRYCLDQKDTRFAERTLDLFKRSTNKPLSETQLNSVMDIYAKEGLVQEMESFIERFIGPKPTKKQIDLHVKSYLRSSSTEHGIPSALQVLHAYEQKNLFPPIESYTRLIISLISTTPPTPPSNRYYTHAWDLFAHMQYVSGHTPDVLLYALMIRSCATSGGSGGWGKVETERALDLWTEMTVDRNLTPNRGAFNAIIYVLARSAVPYSSDPKAMREEKLKSDSYYARAFLLARQMVSQSLNAYGEREGNVEGVGEDEMGPDGNTFKALLLAAKRRGDLARARWILAEVVKLDSENLSSGTKMQGVADASGGGKMKTKRLLDELMMMHVFHAYASYRVPFVRHDVPLVTDASVNVSETTAPKENDGIVIDHAERVSEDANAGSGSSSMDPGSIMVNDDSFTTFNETMSNTSNSSITESEPGRRKYFTATPPQSRSEVIGEASALFEKLLIDNGLGLSDSDSSNFDSIENTNLFSDIPITPYLINSYLSIFYSHAGIERCWKAYDTVFSRLQNYNAGAGVKKTLNTYMNALERCAKGRDRRAGRVEENRHYDYDHENDIRWKWGSSVWGEWCAAIEEIERNELESGRSVGRIVGEGENERVLVRGERARLTERVYAALIRICCLTGRIDTGLKHFDDFFKLYPPSDISPPPSWSSGKKKVYLRAQDPMRLTRVSLYGPPASLDVTTSPTKADGNAIARPLIRLASPIDVVDKSVTPLLTFRDVELLHHRLVYYGRLNDVARIKYVCRCYETALMRWRGEVAR